MENGECRNGGNTRSSTSTMSSGFREATTENRKMTLRIQSKKIESPKEHGNHWMFKMTEKIRKPTLYEKKARMAKRRASAWILANRPQTWRRARAAGSAVVGADGVLPVGARSGEGGGRYIINSWIPTTGARVAVVTVGGISGGGGEPRGRISITLVIGGESGLS